MSGMLSGRAIFGTQPNVLFDASNYSKGQNDALAIQKNRLMLDRAQMENANDQAFRSAAPGAIGGDPAAMTAAVQADPDRALALQTQLASLDSGRRKKVMESMTILGQGAASLLALPEDEAAATYPGLIDRFKGMGLDTSALPPAYPGRAAVETFARGLTPIMDQLKAQDERVVPAGDMSQPRGLRNNNPLNIEAGQFTQSMPGFKGSDGRFAVFESPEQGIAAADALLMRYGMQGRNTPAKIIEKWAPASDGNNVSAYAGSVAKALGIGPNDPIPMEDPTVRRRLIDAMSAVENGKRAGQPRQMVKAGTGMPVTAGGAQYVQNPDGSLSFQPLPARPVAPEAQRLPPGVMLDAAGNRVKDDAYIQAQREIAAGKADVTPPKRIPATIQKMDDEDITAIQTARSLEKDISDIGAMLDAGKFSTGMVDRAGYAVSGALNMSSQEGRDFATFKATVEKIRNDSLRLNKGVQTEGDAVRAGNELVANINDTATVRQRLAELAAINQRAAGLTALKLNRRRVENGLPEIDEAQIVNAPSVLSGARTIARTGKLPDGRKVIQYSDGSTEVQ